MLDPRLSDPQLPVWGIQHLNYAQKREHGVQNWHRQGFTGKGVKVAVIDGYVPVTLETVHGRIKSPYTWSISPESHSRLDNHGQFVGHTFLEFAPDVELHTLPYWSEENVGTLGVLEESIAYCISHDIKVVACSIVGSTRGIVQEMSQMAREAGVLLITSAGNRGLEGFDPDDPEGTKTTPQLASNPDWIAVANIVYPNYPDGEYGDLFDRRPTTSAGPNVFTGAFGGFLSPRFQEGGAVRGIVGTSFACPALAGMMACYVQRHREVHSSDPSYAVMKDFIKNNSRILPHWGHEDLTYEGGLRNYTYGYGFFKLPKEI